MSRKINDESLTNIEKACISLSHSLGLVAKPDRETDRSRIMAYVLKLLSKEGKVTITRADIDDKLKCAKSETKCAINALTDLSKLVKRYDVTSRKKYSDELYRKDLSVFTLVANESLIKFFNDNNHEFNFTKEDLEKHHKLAAMEQGKIGTPRRQRVTTIQDTANEIVSKLSARLGRFEDLIEEHEDIFFNNFDVDAIYTILYRIEGEVINAALLNIHLEDSKEKQEFIDRSEKFFEFFNAFDSVIETIEVLINKKNNKTSIFKHFCIIYDHF